VEQESAFQRNDPRHIRHVVGELKCQGDIVVLVRVQHFTDEDLPRLSPRSARWRTRKGLKMLHNYAQANETVGL
jgi:hypothetical protein